MRLAHNKAYAVWRKRGNSAFECKFIYGENIDNQRLVCTRQIKVQYTEKTSMK